MIVDSLSSECVESTPESIKYTTTFSPKFRVIYSVFKGRDSVTKRCKCHVVVWGAIVTAISSSANTTPASASRVSFVSAVSMLTTQRLSKENNTVPFVANKANNDALFVSAEYVKLNVVITVPS